MYQWRRLGQEQRDELLSMRKHFRYPLHSPRHIDSGNRFYLLTAACYEHRSIIGATAARMAECEVDLLKVIRNGGCEIAAWCILPNHYHVLIRSKNVKDTLAQIGQFHGRTSFLWNGQDNTRGRKVWCNCVETVVKSESHYYATLNCVHHNAVRHGYTEKWQDWPFCSAAQWLEEMGAETALETWNNYPIRDYGKEWDPPGI